MLPNWLAKEYNIVKELEKCNIRINPASYIKRVQLFISGMKINSFESSKPFGYTVIRGGKNSFEMNLKNQAKKLGVNVYTNWRKRIKADIIATGHKRADAIIYGRVYGGHFNPNEVSVFIDFKYCQGGYAYLYPHNKKRASLVVGKLASNKVNIKKSMEMIIENHKNVLEAFNPSLLYEFGGISGFKLPTTAVRNSSLYVGEAAGFQDPFLGFGMKYAIKSGYFSARSVIEGKNYDNIWKNEFKPEMERLLAIRGLFYNMDEKMVSSISKSDLNDLNVEKLNAIIRSKKIGLILAFYNKLPKFLQGVISSTGLKALLHS